MGENGLEMERLREWACAEGREKDWRIAGA